MASPAPSDEPSGGGRATIIRAAVFGPLAIVLLALLVVAKDNPRVVLVNESPDELVIVRIGGVDWEEDLDHLAPEARLVVDRAGVTKLSYALSGGRGLTHELQPVSWPFCLYATVGEDHSVRMTRGF